MGLLPIGCPLGETLGKNLCTSCFGCSFGKFFFLSIIVPEVVLYFLIECFYADSNINRNVFV
jgi:hypothetical protein